MSTKLSFQFSSFPFILKVIGVYRPADFFPPSEKMGNFYLPGHPPCNRVDSECDMLALVL